MSAQIKARSVPFTPEIDAPTAGRIASGRARSAGKAVRAALRLLEVGGRRSRVEGRLVGR